MKKILSLALVTASIGLMALCPPLLAAPLGATEASNATKTKHELREIYIAALKAEGYSPEKNKENEIIFKREGRTFVVTVYDDV